MSIEFLPSHDSTIEAASATEFAIARVIGSVRKEFARETDAWLAERRAAMAELEAIKAQIADAHRRFNEWLAIVSEMRVPARGEQGSPGLQGPPGIEGEPGERGMAGADGRDGRDGLPGVAGPAGRDGANGNDGKDGLGIADLDVDYDGRRTVVLRWSNGERTIEKKFVFPFPIHVGIWEAGRNYEANDQVTYAGGQFMARRDTATRPETDDWILVTKRGAPGTNGKQGPVGPQGPAGRDGRDLTQLGTDGRKW